MQNNYPYITPPEKFHSKRIDEMFATKQPKKKAHTMIDSLLAMDDIKFGNFGRMQSNFIESLLQSKLTKDSVTDLLEMEISSKFGRNKKMEFSVLLLISQIVNFQE